MFSTLLRRATTATTLPQRRMALVLGTSVMGALACHSFLGSRPAQADAAVASSSPSRTYSSSRGLNVTAKLSGGATAVKEVKEVEEEAASSPPAPMSQHDESKGESDGPSVTDISKVLDAMEPEDEARYDDVELEETDCPLCHFMRASPCGTTWVRWEKCIHCHKSKEEDFVGPCARITLRLAECIQKHQDDFPPTLRKALLGGGGGPGDEEEEEKEQEQPQAADGGATEAAAATEEGATSTPKEAVTKEVEVVHQPSASGGATVAAMSEQRKSTPASSSSSSSSS